MADPFVAEIRMFPFNFAPKGWAMCNGQLLPISQNTALFSLLGTTYGGDGRSTFALPDIQDRCVIHPGQGPGLSLYDLGQQGGAETVTLLQSEIPFHTHSWMTATDISDQQVPDPNRVLSISNNGGAYAPGNSALTQLAPQALSPAGASLPHNNLSPYLAVNFCIAMQGVFPARP